MNSSLIRLSNRIHSELTEIEKVIDRVSTGWTRYEKSGDDYFLDSVAFNLHSFYNGLERIFELIAVVVDGSKPQGDNWHQTLLNQMVQECSGIRPAVISDPVRQKLDEYRGFRHVIRNIYTTQIDPEKLKGLVIGVASLFSEVKQELLAFADFLQFLGSSQD